MTDKTTELIERYLEGTLPEKERELVENLLESDENFRRQVQLHKLSEEIVFEKNLLDLKKELAGIMEDKGGFSWKPAYTIITVLIVATGSLLFLYPQAEKKTETVVKSSEITESELRKPSGNSNPVETDYTKPKAENIRSQINAANNRIIENHEPENLNLPEKESQLNLSGSETNADSRIFNQTTANENKVVDQSIPTPSDPCKTSPSLSTEQNEVCKNSNNGSIKINVSGKETYRYSLNDGPYQYTSTFDGLSEGNYNINVIDNNNCTVKKQVLLKSKRCIENVVIVPAQGDTWQLPQPEYGQLKVSVFNRAGQLIFLSLVKKGESKEWNGKSSDGADLPVGGYNAIVENEDGTVSTVTISIID